MKCHSTGSDTISKSCVIFTVDLSMMDAELAWMEKTIGYLGHGPRKALVAAMNSRRRAAGE